MIPSLFHEALRRAELTSAQMIHIGDHAQQDVVAAQQVGITAIWANMDKEVWPGQNPPDAEFHHFDELPMAIDQLLA